MSSIRVFQILSGVIVFAVVGFLGIGVALPHTYRVEASLDVSVPPARAFDVVSDLDTWSMWALRDAALADPGCTFEVGGTAGKAGASVEWKGPATRQGRVALTDLKAGQAVYFEESLDGLIPEGTGIITLEARGEGTHVTWVREGALRPVFGGWLHGVLEARLREQTEQALRALPGALASRTLRPEPIRATVTP